ncbi:MAG: hypothetical protein AAF354_07325 [Pseudomonadota bacterium]
MTTRDDIVEGLKRRCFNCRHHSIPSKVPVCSRREVIASFEIDYEAARYPCKQARHRDGRCGWPGRFFKPKHAANVMTVGPGVHCETQSNSQRGS